MNLECKNELQHWYKILIKIKNKFETATKGVQGREILLPVYQKGLLNMKKKKPLDIPSMGISQRSLLKHSVESENWKGKLPATTVQCKTKQFLLIPSCIFSLVSIYTCM